MREYYENLTHEDLVDAILSLEASQEKFGLILGERQKRLEEARDLAVKLINELHKLKYENQGG